MRTVLVTGGFGFVGSHLVNSLIEAGNRVVVVDNSTAKGGILFKNPLAINYEDSLLHDDLYRKISKYSFDTIYHLAAQTSGEDSQRNSFNDIQNNAYATLQIARFAKNNKINHLVYMSTSAIYGSGCKTFVDEESAISPDSVYGVSKYAGELFIKQVLKDTDTKYTIFRLTNSFGPGENLNYNKKGMVSIFSGMIWKNEPIVVKGSLDRIRNFLYVKDVVKALLMSNKPEASNEIFLLSSGVEVTVGELINCIVEAFGVDLDYPVNVLSTRTSGDTDVFHAKIDKIKNVLGWEPDYTLQDGLKEYVEWISKIPSGEKQLEKYHPARKNDT